VRFLEGALGNRGVLLTPGSPFPEMLYLAHLNVFEVSAGGSTHPGNEAPVLHPGPALRARVAWWLANGSRVIYALGDDTTDFTGDLGGAEKERQVFWRDETAARERAPELAKLRAGLEESGLELHEGLVSTRGNHYAEVRLADAGLPAGPLPARADGQSSQTLRAQLVEKSAGHGDPQLPARMQFLVDLETAIPADPWLACDWMALICEREVEHEGQRSSCRPIEGCDERLGVETANADRPGPGAHAHHAGPAGRHLTPAVGTMIRNAAPGALEPVLHGGFSVTRVDIFGDTIEVAIRDADREYTVTLALADAKRPAPPDGRGRNFLFYLAPTENRSNPAASSALLAAAARFDQAIPDAALQSD
jgi:hypothetical protein